MASACQENHRFLTLTTRYMMTAAFLWNDGPPTLTPRQPAGAKRMPDLGAGEAVRKARERRGVLPAVQAMAQRHAHEASAVQAQQPPSGRLGHHRKTHATSPLKLNDGLGRKKRLPGGGHDGNVLAKRPGLQLAWEEHGLHRSEARTILRHADQRTSHTELG